jgi:thiol-disulfide isomerase/thioredoxin
MKALHLILVLLCGCSVVGAQEIDAEVDELVMSVQKGKKKAVKELSPVAEVLSKGTYMTRKKPNLKAKYYGFLRSASWCVPCKMFVPKLLKDYGKMKGARMELIFLGQEDEAAVKQYMKEGDIDIPGVMPAELGSIPGVQFPNLGVPSLCIVDADGNFVGASGGVNMYEWKKQLQAFKKEQARLKAQKKKAASEHDEPESAR